MPRKPYLTWFAVGVLLAGVVWAQEKEPKNIIPDGGFEKVREIVVAMEKHMLVLAYLPALKYGIVITGIKIVLLGAGSLYFPGLLANLALRQDLSESPFRRRTPGGKI